MPADARSLTMQLHRLDGMAQHAARAGLILLPEDIAELSPADRAVLEAALPLVRAALPNAAYCKARALVEQAEG